jgi:hypothetical protein
MWRVYRAIEGSRILCEVRMMRFNYTYKITYASGQCYDRWNNLDGTSRTTPLKKERDIAGLN